MVAADKLSTKIPAGLQSTFSDLQLLEGTFKLPTKHLEHIICNEALWSSSVKDEDPP